MPALVEPPVYMQAARAVVTHRRLDVAAQSPAGRAAPFEALALVGVGWDIWGTPGLGGAVRLIYVTNYTPELSIVNEFLDSLPNTPYTRRCRV
jgi:hypothetical protein